MKRILLLLITSSLTRALAFPMPSGQYSGYTYTQDGTAAYQNRADGSVVWNIDNNRDGQIDAYGEVFNDGFNSFEEFRGDANQNNNIESYTWKENGAVYAKVWQEGGNYEFNRPNRLCFGDAGCSSYVATDCNIEQLRQSYHDILNYRRQLEASRNYTAYQIALVRKQENRAMLISAACQNLHEDIGY